MQDLLEQIKVLQRERDEARASPCPDTLPCERLTNMARAHAEAMRERDEARAEVARLREALRYLVDECDPDMDDDYNPHAAPLAQARAALAPQEAGDAES